MCVSYIQSNLAKRLFDKRQYCSTRPASRDFRSLCAHSFAVSLSDRNTVSERFSQLPRATTYRGSTVYVCCKMLLVMKLILLHDYSTLLKR